ncbi:hypothetical protein NS96R_13545 [Pseudomonas parafulva]|uniref:Uncharacterized protein n=1 Tax=Pseudomonas parafulva TaxID=157782 RepID=A0AAJ0PF19_9PSED|nr:hypothetical protein NS96R_13545 [Pseudomonas parafulva]
MGCKQPMLSRTWHKRLPGKASNLVPYAGANLIRFNGIRTYAISAFASRHPDKNMRSLDWSCRQSQASNPGNDQRYPG